ncbi:MAG: murein peptide amidase A [Cellvibrionaceae bacterium]
MFRTPTIIKSTVTTLLACSLFAGSVYAESNSTTATPNNNKSTSHNQTTHTVESLCREVGRKLGSVSIANCLQQNLYHSDGHSTQGRPITTKEYPPLASRRPLGRVLLMGGIHGDEFSAVSIMFRWMEKLDLYHSGLFHWQVVPLLNPDGLLRKRSQRQNHNGIDLNRNFPTPDWHQLAKKYWEKRTYRNPRRFPGKFPGSEPETKWFMKLIKDFEPDAIIAVHAPHKLVDFDGPTKAPQQLGPLRLRQLGIYPGSLGNYGGVHLGIPVVTVELPSAGIMPSEKEISQMWVDLVRWLRSEVPKYRAAKFEKSNKKSS